MTTFNPTGISTVALLSALVAVMPTSVLASNDSTSAGHIAHHETSSYGYGEIVVSALEYVGRLFYIVDPRKYQYPNHDITLVGILHSSSI
jgi:hypothetical protein